jgi:hypothetical protein
LLTIEGYSHGIFRCYEDGVLTYQNPDWTLACDVVNAIFDSKRSNPMYALQNTPNPLRDVTKIQLPFGIKASIIRIYLYDIVGTEIQLNEFELDDSNQVELNLSNLRAGMYSYKVCSSETNLGFGKLLIVP